MDINSGSDDRGAGIANLFSAQDLVVVITGGGTGIGLVFAASIARSGARKVYVLGRRIDALNAAVTDIEAPDGVVTPIICDVTNPFTVTAAVEQVKKEFGYVDVLINNAGMLGANNSAVYEAKSIHELSARMLNDWPSWQSTFQVNVAAIVQVSAQFLPLLEAGNTMRGWAPGKLEPGGKPRARSEVDGIDARDLRTSQIISVASIAGLTRRITIGFPYTSTKAGAIILGKSLASMLAPWGIRSNVICPGLFPSEMTTDVPNEASFDKIPAGRMGTYDEMAGAILSLVGRSGAYSNGGVMILDGGRLSVLPSTE